MDHSEAVKAGAVERYALGDLTASEVEEFERHFFDCSQCSEDLRMLTILQDNARAVFLEQSPPPSEATATETRPLTNWWRGLVSAWQRPWVVAPAMVALVIAVFAGYEAGMRRPGGFGNQDGSAQEISAYPLYAASRGEETVIVPTANVQFYELYMDRTWESDFPSYRAVVRADGTPDNSTDAERWSMHLAAPAPGRAIHILMPIRELGAGRYVLTIFGIGPDGREMEVARYPFTLRFE